MKDVRDQQNDAGNTLTVNSQGGAKKRPDSKQKLRSKGPGPQNNDYETVKENKEDDSVAVTPLNEDNQNTGS